MNFFLQGTFILIGIIVNKQHFFPYKIFLYFIIKTRLDLE